MKPPDSKKSGGLLCYIKEKALITGMIKTLLWLRRLDLNQRPLAVPEKNLRAVRLLDFFDRCAILCCPSSAIVGAAE